MPMKYLPRRTQDHEKETTRQGHADRVPAAPNPAVKRGPGGDAGPDHVLVVSVSSCPDDEGRRHRQRRVEVSRVRPRLRPVVRESESPPLPVRLVLRMATCPRRLPSTGACLCSRQPANKHRGEQSRQLGATWRASS